MRSANLLLVTMALVACGGTAEQAPQNTAPTQGGAGGAAGTGGSSAGAGGHQAGAGGHQAGAGGTAGSLAGAAGAAGTGGSPADPLVGSYDLVLGQFGVTSGSPPPTKIFSDGLPFRLDIEKSSSDYRAAVTPRWGGQYPLLLQVSQTEVLLSGKAQVFGSDEQFTGEDTWSSFSIPRTAQGKLGGTVKATGEEFKIAGDIAFQYALEAAGSVYPDIRVPEAKVIPAKEGSPLTGRLPWDAVILRYAEGVLASDLAGAISLTAGSGAINVSWQDQSTETGLDWAGRIQSVGYLPFWSLSNTTPLLQAKGGIRDLALLGTAPYQETLSFLYIDGPVVSYTLDGDAGPIPTSWGEIHYYGQKTGTDPHCEVSGCLQLGPFDNFTCPHTPVGLAGRIKGPLAVIELRYRMVAASQPWDSGPPTDWDAPFWLDIATPGVAPLSKDAPILPYTNYIGEEQGETWWATEWASLVVEVPDPSKLVEEIGFAVHAGYLSSCMGEMMMPAKRLLVIEGVIPVGIK